MNFIIIILVAIFFGFVCMTMAEKRGREKWLGFLLGFLLGFWAVIGYLFAGDTSEKKANLIADAMKKSKQK